MIRKVVIPAAGLGTRFLPYTKAIPKEMLPILNKPVIQYNIEEGLESGISDFFLITSKGKNAIADHIDVSHNHEVNLDRDKQNLLSCTNRIGRLGNYTYIRQREPLGLGHAISLAQNCISAKEYFGVILPDDIIDAKEPALKQLLRVAAQEKATVIAVQEVPANQVSQHDIVMIKKTITPHLFQISQIIEKPQLKNAPSTMAVVGRYVLSGKIFSSLDYISTLASDEINLSRAINDLMQNNERVFAYKISGTCYNLDTPQGWLQANIASALKNPDYAQHVRAMLTPEKQMPDQILYNPAKAVEFSL